MWLRLQKAVAKTSKSAIAKTSSKSSMPQKRKYTQKHCRVPIHKFKQKNVKLPHHIRVFSDCDMHNISRTIKLKHTEITCFLSHWS
jgi:hypothetical protein